MPDNRLCHEWVGNKCRHCGVVYGSVDGPTEGAVADLASVAVLLASAVQEYPDFDDGVPENAKPFIEIAKRLDSLACAVLAAPSPEAPAPDSAPKALTAVARLQSHISDRPYSTGQEIFEVVILDRARAKDGMLLYTNPASEPKTMTLTDEKVDAFAERMVFINKQVGRNIVREIERALLADRGS